MQFRNSPKRLLALLLCVLLVSATGHILSVSAASLNDQIASLERKQAAIKSEIAGLKKDISKQQQLKSALQKQINNVQSQIDLYNGEISKINGDIGELEDRIQETEQTLSESKEAFKGRLRAMYLSGEQSSLALILSADNFGDFLYKSELMRSVAAYDSQVIDELNADIQQFQADQAVLEEKKASVNAMKSSVASKQSELNGSMKELNAVISNLNEEKSDLEKESAEYTAAIKALEKQIAAATQQAQSSKVVYSGAQFQWPVPGYYNITSGFRTAKRPNHNGIDIASSGIYGKPIVAAADGEVLLAANNGNGYGLYVMINHGTNNGNTYITLYGHMSKMAVSKGQKVKAGQTIGYVGSTGRSTGPHLHYEIRVNGSARSPLSFYNKVG